MPHEIMSEEIEAILISTFGFEMETFLPIAKSGKQLLVVNMQRENPEGAVDHNYSGFENMKVISPPKRKKGYGVFHTKLWLIKFGTFLRVVVGTGNNHVNDWTVWQNAYWFNDFPLKQE